jgi:hypothetical protein
VDVRVKEGTYRLRAGKKIPGLFVETELHTPAHSERANFYSTPAEADGAILNCGTAIETYLAIVLR